MAADFKRNPHSGSRFSRSLHNPIVEGPGDHRLWHRSHSTITNMTLTIRPAIPEDVGQILTFIRALATYEREPDAVTATAEDLLRDGFGPNPYYSCLIAEQDGTAAGFALFFYDYSTWLGKPGLYLEDVFVHPEFRGRGIGKALLQRVANIAIGKGCPRLKWEVLDWNAPAIEFYSALGSEFLDTWRNVRVSGAALLRLAGAEQPADQGADADGVR